MVRLVPVVVDGVKYLPTQISSVPLKADESPEQGVERLKPALAKNWSDELVFYRPGERALMVAHFTDLPAALRRGGEEKPVCQLEGSPEAVVLHQDDEPEEYPLARIEIVGVVDPAVRAQVAEILDLDPGDEVSAGDLLEAREKILEKCPVLAVKFVPTPDAEQAGKMRLSVQVIDAPRGVDVLDLASDDPARKEIEQLFAGQLFTQAAIEKIGEVLTVHYAKADHLYIVTRWNISAEGRLQLGIVKTPMPKEVWILGVDEVEETALQQFFPGPHSPASLEAGMSKVRAYFEGHGELAILESGIVTNERNENVFSMRVTRRPAPTMVAFTGQHPFKTTELIEIFGAPTGPKGTYTAAAIAAGAARIKAYAEGQGYQVADSSRYVIKDGVLAFTLNLKRLIGYEVLYLQRKTGLDSRLVERELSQRAGDFFNAKELAKGLGRVRATGHFHSVSPSIDAAAETVSVSLLIVPGPEITSVSVGGGYQADTGWMVMASGKLLHIPVAGEALELSGHYSPNAYGASVGWFDPWAFPGKISAGASLYFRVEDIVTANERVGIGGNVGIPLGGTFSPWRVIVGTNVEYIHLEDPESIPGVDGDPYIVKPVLKLVYADPQLTAFVQGRFPFGAVTYQETRAGVQYDLPLGHGFSLRFAGAGGMMFGSVPLFEQYNVMNSPSTYGRTLSTSEFGTDFVVASVNVHKMILDTPYVSIAARAGVTVGGIGGRRSDIGMGGALDLVLMGTPLSFELGGRRRMTADGSWEWGFNLLMAPKAL